MSVTLQPQPGGEATKSIRDMWWYWKKKQNLIWTSWYLKSILALALHLNWYVSATTIICFLPKFGIDILQNHKHLCWNNFYVVGNLCVMKVSAYGTTSGLWGCSSLHTIWYIHKKLCCLNLNLQYLLQCVHMGRVFFKFWGRIWTPKFWRILYV
jgi:hypothetical protein